VELERFYSFEAGYGVETEDDPAWLRRRAVSHFRLLAAGRAPGRLLDIGCGAGYFVEEARRGGWDAAGIDLNADVVRMARGRGLPVERGRIRDMTVAPGSFDAVTLWDSLEHVDDPSAVLRACRSAMRPGAALGVSTPNIGGLYPVLSYPVGRLTGYWTHPEPPAHLFQFSVSTLSQLLVRSGFEIDRVVHGRSPIKYTLAPGGLRLLSRHPARVLYAAAFLPVLLLGPLLRLGDDVTVIATAA
jgi:SAM-dependent methyltransferase